MTVAGRASRRYRHALDAMHDRKVNFDLARRDEYRATQGWKVDRYCQALPPEPPGPPLPAGSWAIACRLLRDYEFADPGIVRAIYYPDQPLDDRTMLLVGRFYGLRFLLGVRVGGVIDELREVDGRQVQVWGWNYRTLQGHLEMGQLDYEAWKWLDTGEVEFRMDALSRAADIRNPIVRLGFRVFGRHMQRRFSRRACERMHRLVVAELTRTRRGHPALDDIDVRPVSATDERTAARYAERAEP